LDAGQKDTISLGADGASLIYSNNEKELVTIRVGATFQHADYEIALRPSGHADGAETDIANLIERTTRNHVLRVKHRAKTLEVAYVNVNFSRRDANEDAEFDSSLLIDIEPSECILLKYGSWTTNGQELTVIRDAGCDGQVLETLALPDEG
jgi:hypothetical protein